MIKYTSQTADISADRPRLSVQLMEAIADCVPAIGTGDFTERFLHIVTVIGADQATAFAYERAKASCLLSRNFLTEEMSGTLAAVYVDGWYFQDPLFAQVMAMDDDVCVVKKLEGLLPSMSSEYFTIFFGDAGWRTKVAIIISQQHLKMVLNLYFVSQSADQHTDPLGADRVGFYKVIGRLLATHFLRSDPLGVPVPLAVLSERERQVCIGMLEGKKAEIIAEEMGIGASSVVTYRQRAYQKLGISSRGQLFSICRS